MRLGFFGFIILVAIFGVGIGGAYAAGNIAGRAAESSTRTTVSASSTSGATGNGTSPTGGFSGNRASGQNRAGGTNGADGSGTAARAVTGTVDSVENGKISVSTPQGQTQTLTVADNTQVQKSSPAALSDVTKGERVLVTTRAGQNGELTAVSIQILPSN